MKKNSRNRQENKQEMKRNVESSGKQGTGGHQPPKRSAEAQRAHQGRVTIGLDLGDKYSSFCVLDTAGGEVIQRGRVRTKAEALRKLLQGYAQAEVGMETGTHCRWVRDVVESCGQEAVIGHARDLRSLYQSHDKNDDNDAEKIARILRADRKLFHPVKLRSQEAQVDLAVLRGRAALVEARTRLVNTIRSLSKNFGAPLAKCSAEAFVNRAWEQIPKPLRAVTGPMFTALEALNGSIRLVDKGIDYLAEQKYPQTQLLKQVKGVGNLTAVGYILTLGERERFERSRDVGVYLGLTPGQDQSGQSLREKRITKAGNRYLRKLLVQSAHYILGPFGPDTALRRFGQRLIAAGGRTKKAKKRAAVAVARKLAVLLHKLWGGEVYEPLHGIEPTATA